MAKESAERVPSSGGGMATLLMIVAVVATVGLLVWLSFASRPQEGPAMAMDPVAPADAGPMAPTVAAADFGADIASHVGQAVNLAGVTVSNVINEQLMWVDVPTAQGSTQFTVRLLPGAAATPPMAQTRVDVEGRVLAKTDSVLNAWEQAGAIPDASVRTTLQTGSYFIEATAIRPGSAPGGD